MSKNQLGNPIPVRGLGALLSAIALISASTGLVSATQVSSFAEQPRPMSWSASPQTVAQRSRVKRIQFAPGASSGAVEDAVERGTRNIYLVGASKGQTLTVKITSIENNAVFDVAAPSGKIGQQRRLLLREASEWTTVLPASGDYQIIVGSTRGNASFRLQVTIR
jgi:hypothetical protein